MPELPDVEVYVGCLRARLLGQPLLGVRLASPFLLRTVEPRLADLIGRRFVEIRRLGKRLIFGLEDELVMVLHLMVAGRLRWKAPRAPLPGKLGLAAFDLATGTLILTEASPKKRASLHVVRGAAAVAEFDRGGLDVLGASPAAFAERLRRDNHTVKRALTDPTIFDGIGNAYSDEILHHARRSPFKLTRTFTDAEAAALQASCQHVLTTATARLRAEVGDGFPDKVTAFRPEMAVHGKHGQPCPVCGSAVQRIAYADNEANYCATCQTEGRLLADRSLSRLLKDDWPRTLAELEERRRRPA